MTRPGDRYRQLERDRLFQLAVETASDPTREPALQEIARRRLTSNELDDVDIDRLSDHDAFEYRRILRVLVGEPDRVTDVRKPVATERVYSADQIALMETIFDLGVALLTAILDSQDRAEAEAARTDSP